MDSQTSTATQGTSGGPQRLGRPILNTWEAIAQSLAIGPIFSIAFVATLVVSVAGISAPLSILFAAIGMLCVGWIITLYARRYAGAGAIYDYLRRFSPALGIFSASLYFIGLLVLAGIGGYPAIGFLLTISALGGLLPFVPWWAYALIVLVFVFAMNHFGIRLTTRIQLILTALSAIPFLILAVAILISGGAAGHTLEMFNPANAQPGVFQGVLFAITIFIGFEAAASLGEETANPRRSIPIAVAGTVILASVFYLLIIYAEGIGFGLSAQGVDQWSKDPAPLDTLATRYVGGWLAVLINLAVLIDVVVSVSAFTGTTARGIFSLARHGFLPTALARTTNFGTRPDTPLGGNLVLLVCGIIGIAFVAFTNTEPLVAFAVTVGWGTILIVAIYLILVLGAIPILRSEPGKWWQWPIFVLALIAPVLGLYGSVYPLPPWPNIIGVYGSVAVIVLAAIWVLVLRARQASKLAAAASSYNWESEFESETGQPTEESVSAS